MTIISYHYFDRLHHSYKFILLIDHSDHSDGVWTAFSDFLG